MTSPLERRIIDDIKTNIEAEAEASVDITVLDDGVIDVTSTETNIDALEFGAPGQLPTRPVAKGVARTINNLELTMRDIDPKGILF